LLKRTVSGIILTLLLIGMFTLAFNIQPVKSEPRTWTVDDDGPADFSSIQEAINSPQVIDGDTIFVYNGTYYENVVVNKTISLIGEKDLTIVDGNYTGNVFYVVANNVFLSGFKIQNSGNYEAVLISYSNGSVLTDNLIRGGKGVSLVSSNNNTLENNIIYGGSPNCIKLQNSSENAIIRNSIEWAFIDSIRLEYSNNNTVVRNNITYNSQGSGLALHNSSSNILRENRIDGVFRAAVALFSNSNYNLVEYNVAINGRNHGIICSGSNNNIIRGNYIADNYYQGISLELTDYNTIVDNTITRNAIAELYDSSGISLEQASHNILERNNITANKHHGIRLASSSNNVLRDNVMASNGYNFGVFGQELSDFINDVNASNTVDGKPVYYWINKHDQEVPQDAGYVALINSTNITIENLISGVSLAYTENSKIQNVTATNSYYGIQLYWSLNNSITSSNITKNCFGILLYSSSKNNIVENSITNNSEFGIYLWESTNNTLVNNMASNHKYDGICVVGSSYNMLVNDIALDNRVGIYLSRSNYNTLIGNSVSNNSNGIRLDNSRYNVLLNNTASNNYDAGMFLDGGENNTFLNNIIAHNHEYGIRMLNSAGNTVFHNNLINNAKQVYVTTGYVNTWDDGYPSGGNYWSDYTGIDSKSGPNQDQPGSDGIGDTPYIIDANNTDRYPFKAPINMFDAGTWNGASYNVNVVSNSTVSDFYFNPDEGAFLRFSVTGESGTVGFCKVAIRKQLLWVESGQWVVLLDDVLVTPTITEDANHTYLYFTYNHSTKTVVIQGTHVIPEFPSFLILSLSMMATLLAIITSRRKRFKHQTGRQHTS